MNRVLRQNWIRILIPFLFLMFGGMMFVRWSGSRTSQKTTSEKAESGASPSAPKRVVSLAPSITEVFLLLDQSDRLVGVTTFSKHLEPVRHLPEIGGFTNTNYERILSLKPDLVIMKSTRDNKQATALSEAGVSTMTVKQETIKDILLSIRRIGNKLRMHDRAVNIVQKMKHRIQEIKRSVRNRPKPTVLPVYYRDYGSDKINQVGVTGKTSYLGEMITIAGGKNVYSGPMSYPKFSPEFVLRKNPAYIIDFTTHAVQNDLSRKELRRDWQALEEVKAVRKNQVYLVSAPYALLPGPRFLLILERVVQILHPDVQLSERNWKLF